MMHSIRKSGGTALVLIGLMLLWQSMHMMVGAGALTSPWVTVVKLAGMLASGELNAHMLETGKALLYALVLALAGGIVLGVALGMHRLSGNVAEPILLNLYSIPKVALYPLILLVFGLGLSAKVAFGVMHGLIPILVFTMNGIRQMRPVYLRTARTMRMPLHRTVLHVLLPAVLPEVISGLRLGFSLTLLGVLIGEMFASQSGLGYLITNAMGLGDIASIMAVALLLTVFAVVCNGLFMLFDRRVHHK
ncbi:MAG: nitrate transporter permease [Herbaspirillum sp.]|jgi:NitT/TauT family transport system permease protein|nr:nitrate transporter permease [Herbaspirillum sp.]